MYSGKNNIFFEKEKGVTAKGEALLSEIYEAGLILDISHISDTVALVIADIFKGRIIVSHCACTDLYAQQNPRSNSLSRSTLYKLAEQVEVFGLSFVNDIISSNEYETNSNKIYIDIITQITLFVDTVGASKVALGPDYYDTVYFSEIFHLELTYPDNLMSQKGLIGFYKDLNATLSENDVNHVFYENVKRLLDF